MADTQTFLIAGAVLVALVAVYYLGVHQNRNDFYPDVFSVVPTRVPGVHRVVFGGIPHSRFDPVLWVGQSGVLRHGAHQVGVYVDGVRRVGGRAVLTGRLNMPGTHVRALSMPVNNLRLRMRPSTH